LPVRLGRSRGITNVMAPRERLFLLSMVI